MTSVAGSVRVNARLDNPISRWLWLVKWLLVLPHIVLLALLWVAFGVLSVFAFVAILITGRYPGAIFDFNLGVLRWTWRVVYYSCGALGTDRYPPFTLGAVSNYPATLDIAHPARLSRGLVLVKWWLLALPHYLVIAFFVGGGGYAAAQAGRAGEPGGWSFGGGLIGLLTLIAGVVLLFTGRYPRGVFDFLLGMHRWVLRVVAYATLMTDSYPPFRLDPGGDDPAGFTVASAAAPDAAEVVAAAPEARWTTGRVVTVVLGSLLVAGAFGAVVGGTTLLLADRAGRDADGFIGTGLQTMSTPGHALVLDPVELRGDPGAPDLDAVLGQVRVTATGSERGAVFVGIGPAADVEFYLGDVARSRLSEAGPGRSAQLQPLPGGAPATPPGQQGFWSASASGPGIQRLIWTASQGRWAIVVMNADGSSPVTAAVSAAVTAPALHWVWTGLFLGAGLALISGLVLVGLALPRRPRQADTAPLVPV